jgi:hypothetical protein
MGATEADDTQTVHLRGYVGAEPTLMVTTQLALESLGGTSSRDIPDDVLRDYGQPITESELKDRFRQAKRDMRKVRWTLILMLPVLIPVYAVGSVWMLITTLLGRWRRPKPP